MKKLTMILTVLALTAMVAGAFAQVNPWWENSVGIYTDEGYPCTTFSDMELHSCYLTLRNATSVAGVMGWEGVVGLEGDGMIVESIFQGTNFVSLPLNFAVGCGSPLPYSSEIVLAEFVYMLMDPLAGLDFYLGPLSEPSIPGALAYADGADPNILVEMYISSGSEVDPVFVVNGNCPVATVESSWGGVKTMFR